MKLQRQHQRGVNCEESIETFRITFRITFWGLFLMPIAVDDDMASDKQQRAPPSSPRLAQLARHVKITAYTIFSYKLKLCCLFHIVSSRYVGRWKDYSPFPRSHASLT